MYLDWLLSAGLHNAFIVGLRGLHSSCLLRCFILVNCIAHFDIGALSCLSKENGSNMMFLVDFRGTRHRYMCIQLVDVACFQFESIMKCMYGSVINPIVPFEH